MTTRLTPWAILISVLVAGCALPVYVDPPPRNDVSFGGNVSVSNGTFHLEGEIRLGVGAASHHNYSNISVVLYDEHRREIKSVYVGRMSTKSEWGKTEKRLNITADTVPTYVVIESPDFWTNNEVEVVSLWIHVSAHDGLYDRYARTGPGDTKFPCEVKGLHVNASHCS